MKINAISSPQWQRKRRPGSGAIDNGGGTAGSNGMDARISKIEEMVGDNREKLARIEACLEYTPTKSDLHELRTATKSDLHELRTATKSDLHELRTATKNDLHELRTATKNDLHELRTEIKNDLHELRTETKNDLHELRTETKNGLYELSVTLHKEINSQTWKLMTFVCSFGTALVAATYFIVSHAR